MRRILMFIVLAVVLVGALTACGGDKYGHEIGGCQVENARFQAQVWTYRITGGDAAEAARFNADVCAAVKAVAIKR